MSWKNICSIVMIGVLSSQALMAQCSSDYQKSTSNDEDGFSPANYQFQYAVNEGTSGNDFGHEEERNGHQTRGQYRVLLPDGRLQVVSYTADKNGYRAEVTYQNGGGGGYSAPPSVQKNRVPPPPPPAPPSQETTAPDQSYGVVAAPKSAPPTNNNAFAFNKNSGGSFVKLRRNINGRNFNYSF